MPPAPKPPDTKSPDTKSPDRISDYRLLDRGQSTNLVSVPTGLLASTAFNAYPVPLHISCVRETNRTLFSMLKDTQTPEDAADLFQAYMAAVFDLDDQDRNGRGPARFRASS